jgi:hypothetical protein
MPCRQSRLRLQLEGVRELEWSRSREPFTQALGRAVEFARWGTRTSPPTLIAGGAIKLAVAWRPARSTNLNIPTSPSPVPKKGLTPRTQSCISQIPDPRLQKFRPPLPMTHPTDRWNTESADVAAARPRKEEPYAQRQTSPWRAHRCDLNLRRRNIPNPG